MYALNLKTVGASTEVEIPQALLDRLQVGPGDTIYVTQAPDGGFRLTSEVPAFTVQMSLAEQIMHEDQAVLHALAQ
jgi:putative addiction module antidote